MPVSSARAFDGAVLRRAREAAGLSRAEFGQLIDTDAEMVSLWEEHGVTPTPSRIKRIAEAAGIPVDNLYRLPAGVSPLVAMRTKAGLSQRALAQRVQVSQAFISRLERGTAELTPELAQSIADTVGASAEEVEAAIAKPVRNSGPQNDEATYVSRDEPPSVTARGPGSTVHIVLVYLLEYEDDVLVRHSEQPALVHSPRGFRIEGGDSASTKALADRTLSWLAADVPGPHLKRLNFVQHYEARIVMDGEPVYALRRQYPGDDGRNIVFDSLATLLTPQWPNPVTGEDDPAVKATLRRELFTFLPEAAEDVGRLFIAAEPTDTWEWLRDQVPPSYGALAVVFADPDIPPGVHLLVVADDAVKANTRRPDGSKPNRGFVAVSGLGITGGTTLGEIARRLADR